MWTLYGSATWSLTLREEERRVRGYYQNSPRCLVDTYPIHCQKEKKERKKEKKKERKILPRLASNWLRILQYEFAYELDIAFIIQYNSVLRSYVIRQNVKSLSGWKWCALKWNEWNWEEVAGYGVIIFQLAEFLFTTQAFHWCTQRNLMNIHNI